MSLNGGRHERCHGLVRVVFGMELYVSWLVSWLGVCDVGCVMLMITVVV